MKYKKAKRIVNLEFERTQELEAAQYALEVLERGLRDLQVQVESNAGTVTGYDERIKRTEKGIQDLQHQLHALKLGKAQAVDEGAALDESMAEVVHQVADARRAVDGLTVPDPMLPEAQDVLKRVEEKRLVRKKLEATILEKVKALEAEYVKRDGRPWPRHMTAESFAAREAKRIIREGIRGR